MNRLIVTVLLVLLPYYVNAEFKTDDEASKWITYYYKNPEPNKLPQAVEYMSRKGWLAKKSAAPPIFGFLSGVFKDNPEKIDEWMKGFSELEEEHYGITILGLWYANLPESQEKVYEILSNNEAQKKSFNYLYSGTSMSVEDIPLEQGSWVLDALWGKFMATGKKAPVDRIMEALPWFNIKGDVNRLVIGGAARWSLSSNAIQHKLVLEYCEQSKVKKSAEISKHLEVIVQEATAEANNGHNN